MAANDPLERPWLPPEFADQMRDARALVRCALSGDDLGTSVIRAALRDDGQADAVAALLAEMVAELVRHCGRHWLAQLVRPDEGS